MIIPHTNVISEWMRKDPEQNVLLWLGKNDSALVLPSVVVAEIAFGIERIRLPERSVTLGKAFAILLDHFSGRFVSFDVRDALLYGKLMGESAQRGITMSIPDGMIAALAQRHGARLATRNIRHFDHLGIDLINPWTDGLTYRVGTGFSPR